jgi:hypothetical protein
MNAHKTPKRILSFILALAMICTMMPLLPAPTEAAAQRDIVNGLHEGSFAPDDALTREQMAVIVTNYANFAKIIM